MDETTPIEQQPLHDTYRYVGVWYRFLARIIDGFIVSIVGSPLLITIFVITFTTALKDVDQDAATAFSTLHFTTNQSLIVGACSFLYLLLTASYYIFFHASKLQGTLGKRMLGIKVVDTSGKRIDVGRSAVRYLATDGLGIPNSLLSNSTNTFSKGVASFFGFIAAVYTITDASIGGSDTKKQTLHDRIAKTYVIYREN